MSSLDSYLLKLEESSFGDSFEKNECQSSSGEEEEEKGSKKSHKKSGKRRQPPRHRDCNVDISNVVPENLIPSEIIASNNKMAA